MMKYFLALALILIGSSLGAFSLNDFCAKNSADYSYDPDFNILTLRWNGRTFNFFVNGSVYYEGIKVYYLTRDVTVRSNDFLIDDDFLSRWMPKKGIHKFEVTRSGELTVLTFFSFSKIAVTNTDIGCFTLEGEDPSDIKPEYQNDTERGIEYIKSFDNKVELKFTNAAEISCENSGTQEVRFVYKILKPVEKLKEPEPVIKKSNGFDKKKITIVLDPGHGGKDPGAIGITGVKEKAVVLSLSKQIHLLLKDLGYSVLLTRSSDNFIPLRQRTEFANKNNASLFVSVHANVAFNPGVYGFDIYYLSTSASDDESRQVAAYENNVIKLEQAEKKDTLGEIIWSMLSNEFENESITLGGILAKHMKEIGAPNGNPVKHARFYVLYGATMPAILIESGFLTNKKEEAKLKNQEYQKKLAERVVGGLDEYIEKNYRKFIND